MGAGAAANLPAPLYLRQSLGRCRGRSSPARPPRAAACCPAAPGQWVLGSLEGPRVAGWPGCSRCGAACPRTRAGREARCRPSDLTMFGKKPCVHSTPQCPQMGVLCARPGLPHPKDMQEHECAHWWALHGASPTLGLCHPFVVGIPGSTLFLTAVFREEVPISMNGLGNASKEWQRFKLRLMSIQWVCQHLSVVTVRHHEVG